MTDYKCPNCGGGFPANAAVDGECPWCARGMEGGSDSSPPEQPVPTREIPRIARDPPEPDIDVPPTPPIYPQVDVPDPATHIPHLRIGGGASGGDLLTQPTANPDASAGERIETLAERGEVTNTPAQPERDPLNIGNRL